MNAEQNKNIIFVDWGSISNQLKARFDCFPQVEISQSEVILLKNKSQIVDFMKVLKKEFGFHVLSLINAVEYQEAIQLIYQIQKIDVELKNLYIKINLTLTDLEVNSITSIWNSANWFEREMYDMHGIVFKEHPNLVRILNPENWEGFPLRKDYIQPLDILNEKQYKQS